MQLSRLSKWGVMLLVLLLASCGGSRSPLYPDTPSYDPDQDQVYKPDPNLPGGYNPDLPAEQTYTVLKNIFLRVDPEIGVFVKHLEGRMEAKRQGDPIIYGDVRSFTTHVARGEMVIDQENITRLKNKYTFNFPETPIKNVNVEFMPGRIKMSGMLKQVIWVNFSMEGSLTPTPEGKILLTPDSIKVAGLQMKSLMDIIGLTTSKMISIGPERGLTFVGNNVILDPSNLFPPPKMEGRVVGVKVNQGNMSLLFDSGTRIPPRNLPDTSAQNYIHVYGGRVLIMNELHYGAEMQMIDLNQSNHFDFFLSEYLQHLRAGYVKVGNELGTLITMMPDYNDIGKTAGTPATYSSFAAVEKVLRPIQHNAYSNTSHASYY